MNISGPLPPIGGPDRAAKAYGFTPKPTVSTVSTVQTDKTDSLRSVLTDDERAYFDQIASLGPITYGRSAKPGMVPEAPRGLRLDVRG
jgi:hypothetical protein